MTEQAAAPNERTKRLQARKARIAATIPRVERVRVNPASDALRQALKHPSGVQFPESGSVEWPLDSFTKRRIKEGSVTKEEAPQQSRARNTRPSTAAKED